MMKGVSAAVLAFCCGVLLQTASAPVHADDDDQREVRAALARGEVLPLKRILAIVAERAPGDVVKIELEREGALIVYEIKVLAPTGRLLEVEVDARSGKVLSIEDD